MEQDCVAAITSSKMSTQTNEFIENRTKRVVLQMRVALHIFISLTFFVPKCSQARKSWLKINTLTHMTLHSEKLIDIVMTKFSGCIKMEEIIRKDTLKIMWWNSYQPSPLMSDLKVNIVKILVIYCDFLFVIGLSVNAWSMCCE